MHPGGTGTPTQQGDFKHGAAGCAGFQRLARRRSDPPARVSRAWNRFSLQPDQEQGHPRLLGGKGQSPAGGKIERRTLPTAFNDQRRKTGATRGIGRGLEQRLGIGRDAQYQRVRIAAQLDKAWPMKPPAKPFGFVGSKPENGRSPADCS